MSEEWEACQFCGALFRVNWNTRADESELAALREENERLRNANPWRYPLRGELPERDDFYFVSCGSGSVDCFYWCGGKWGGEPWEENSIYAWRELPEPAPKLEDE